MGGVNMKEDYVSFKIAKLLKRKGFDWTCSVVYDLERPKSCEINKYYTNFGDSNHNKWSDLVSAPTIQRAMKWLREIHHIHTDIIIEGNSSCIKYYSNIRPFRIMYPTRFGDSIDTIKIGTYNTYEEACESAIKYCLTNLI